MQSYMMDHLSIWYNMEILIGYMLQTWIGLKYKFCYNYNVELLIAYYTEGRHSVARIAHIQYIQ